MLRKFKEGTAAAMAKISGYRRIRHYVVHKQLRELTVLASYLYALCDKAGVPEDRPVWPIFNAEQAAGDCMKVVHG